MPEIRTILGPINSDQMGWTDSHVHLIVDSGLVLQQFPAWRFAEVDKTCQEVELFMQAGGRAVVEMSALGWGRNARKLIEVARRTGLQIVACTGLHKASYYLDSHWRNYYTPDQMARLFIEEITLGMDANNYEGPFVERVEARAGVVKISTEYEYIGPAEKNLIRAAAITHLETGAPISTHAEKGTMALEQVKLLMSYGVDPAHVAIAHMDHNPDLYEHREVASTGAYLMYDTMVRRKYWQRTHVLSLYRQMIDAGYGKQLLFASDMGSHTYFASYGYGPGLAHGPSYCYDRMKREGFDQETLDQIFYHNPARVFSFAPVR